MRLAVLFFLLFFLMSGKENIQPIHMLLSIQETMLKHGQRNFLSVCLKLA